MEPSYSEAVVTSRYELADDPSQLDRMPIIDPDGLIGHTFLMNQQDDGQNFCERVIEAINAHDENVTKNPEIFRFRFSINN